MPRISPQASHRRLGVRFRELFVVRILNVVLGEPSGHQIEVDQSAINVHVANASAITVGITDDHFHILSENGVGQEPLGVAAERMATIGRVAGQSRPHCRLVRQQDIKRIAIDHTDNSTDDCCPIAANLTRPQYGADHHRIGRQVATVTCPMPALSGGRFHSKASLAC